MSLINVGTKERNIGTGIVHNVCLFLSNRLRNTASIYNYLQVEHNLGMLDGHPGSQQVLAVQLEHSIIYLILLDPPWHALRSPWLPAGPSRSARTQHRPHPCILYTFVPVLWFRIRIHFPSRIRIQ